MHFCDCFHCVQVSNQCIEDLDGDFSVLGLQDELQTPNEEVSVSVYLIVCSSLFVCLFVCLSVCLCLSLCLSLFMCVSVCLSVSLLVCFSVCVFVCLSVSLSFC